MNKLARIACYLKLLPRLGFANALAVAYYRRQWTSGRFEAALPARDATNIEPFWNGDTHSPALDIAPALAQAITARADAICAEKFQRFGDMEIDEGKNPEWHKGIYAQSATAHFTHVNINTVAGEDIKLTWDLSRMHWAPRLALAACITSGEARERYLARLNHLTTDWLTHNPYQRGANWACAHEVAVRGMQLMLSNLILEKDLGLTPRKTLLTLMEQSWQRVYAVRAYARAQHNNHSLAEHLFLIYAAAFLKQHGVDIATQAMLKKLEHQLAPLVDSLIMADGGSVMYSTNYHRVFCDMLSIGKMLDDNLALGLFNNARISTKSRAAFDFLNALIEPISGQMPLIGHNDGSLHSLQFSGFRNAEPSLLLMAAVFGFTAPTHIKRSEHAVWLFGYTPDYAATESAATHRTTTTLRCFDNFGLAIVSSPHYRAYVKYPRNQFRPAQCDFLHVDVWADGKNILHDSGTYSYNLPIPSPCDDLSEAAAHNAPALASMPAIHKLSPFLYAFWPNAVVKQTDDSIYITVPLGQGNCLHRRIDFTETAIKLTDHVRSQQPWQVAFNGDIATISETHATLGNAATMHIDNAMRLAMNETLNAPNYHTVAAAKRLIITPRDAAQPITTTITITA